MVSKIYNLKGLLANDYLANRLTCPRDFISQENKNLIF